MDLISRLKYKGVLKEFSSPEEFPRYINGNENTIYAGFDLTAKSLHVGHLIPILTLKEFFNHGHKIVILLGNATTRIGDPSDKNELRKMLSEEQIEENKKSILYCISKFLPLENQNIRVVENYSWFKDINYLDFLKEVGTCFTINKMVNMDFVRRRLDSNNPITFLEFNYMLIQGYDFYHLYKNFGCNIQLGGSDQWGNILQGVELIKHKFNDAKVFGITTNLLTKSDGTKIGKTTSGAVWLHEEMLSPYDYFQYFRNISDEDVLKFMKIFTDLKPEYISKFESITGEELNQAKEVLAFEATKICHGEKAANSALEKSKSLFKHTDLNHNPDIVIEDSILITDLIFDLKVFDSKSEIRRAIESGSIKISDQKIQNSKEIIKKDVFGEKFIISIGKAKKFLALIK